MAVTTCIWALRLLLVAGVVAAVCSEDTLDTCIAGLWSFLRGNPLYQSTCVERRQCRVPAEFAHMSPPGLPALQVL